MAARTLKSPIDKVDVGDVVLLRPGERVPVDGEVLDGESAIEEAMLTGEPMPVTKRPGDRVAAGTINTTGALQLKATKVGKDTMLAQIIRLVEEAQAGKAPIQRLADRVAEISCPSCWPLPPSLR